jgi:hypothetical protein
MSVPQICAEMTDIHFPKIFRNFWLKFFLSFKKKKKKEVQFGGPIQDSETQSEFLTGLLDCVYGLYWELFV